MDKDIQHLFKKKNKEMLITTLRYDLDKNIGSLMETISNIFNLEFDECIKRVEGILTEDVFNREIINTIEEAHIDMYEMVEALVNKKKLVVSNSIETLVFEQDKINNYYDVILNTTKFLKDELVIKIKEELIKLNNNLVEKKANDPKIASYLNDRLSEKLITKIHMEIMLRDNSLINKAKEGYLRYQDITNKTIDN